MTESRRQGTISTGYEFRIGILRLGALECALWHLAEIMRSWRVPSICDLTDQEMQAFNCIFIISSTTLSSCRPEEMAGYLKIHQHLWGFQATISGTQHPTLPKTFRSKLKKLQYPCHRRRSHHDHRRACFPRHRHYSQRHLHLQHQLWHRRP